jgi:hypothetical protein
MFAPLRAIFKEKNLPDKENLNKIIEIIQAVKKKQAA